FRIAPARRSPPRGQAPRRRVHPTRARARRAPASSSLQSKRDPQPDPGGEDEIVADASAADRFLTDDLIGEVEAQRDEPREVQVEADAEVEADPLVAVVKDRARAGEEHEIAVKDPIFASTKLGVKRCPQE